MTADLGADAGADVRGDFFPVFAVHLDGCAKENQRKSLESQRQILARFELTPFRADEKTPILISVRFAHTEKNSNLCSENPQFPRLPK